MIPAVQRFTRERPCPICQGYGGAARGKGERCFGFLDATGEYARCTREEHAGELPVNSDETYSHRLVTLPPGWSGSLPGDGRGLRGGRRPPPGWSQDR